MNKLINNPLVSIVVITYNSSKYILETLESAKAQTYQKIELIVTDDCSTDDTVEICLNWIADNEYRFVKTELITVAKNTGVPANCNRGVKVAQGEWIKLIAGDDILIDDCILNYMIETKNNNLIFVMCSNVEIFFDENFDLKRKNINYISESDELKRFGLLPSKSQYNFLALKNIILAPSVIIKKSLLNELGGFDLRFPYEDYPLWLKITNQGNKIYYMDKVTVKYRKNLNSITQKRNQNSIISKMYIVEYEMQKELLFAGSSFIRIFIFKYSYYLKNVFIKMDTNIIFNRFLYKLMVQPIKWYKNYFLKRIKY